MMVLPIGSKPSLALGTQIPPSSKMKDIVSNTNLVVNDASLVKSVSWDSFGIRLPQKQQPSAWLLSAPVCNDKSCCTRLQLFFEKELLVLVLDHSMVCWAGNISDILTERLNFAFWTERARAGGLCISETTYGCYAHLFCVALNSTDAAYT